MGSFNKPIDPPDPGCANVVECTLSNPDPMALVLLLAVAGGVLLFVTFAVAHIKTARSLLDEERRRIAAEAEAFATFARRVGDVDAENGLVADGGPTTTAAFGQPRDDGVAAVRDAYRDTVMAIPHYEEEYDESLTRNMQLEFGDDVAAAVDRGGSLTPQLKATLVERSRTARDQRTSLLEQLQGESEALEDADRTLTRCRRTADRVADAPLEHCDYDELAADWRLVDERQETTEALLAGRQETVQHRDRRNGALRDGPSFEEYLYGPLDVTYPVLATGTAVLERLHDARRQVTSALAGHQ